MSVRLFHALGATGSKYALSPSHSEMALLSAHGSMGMPMCFVRMQTTSKLPCAMPRRSVARGGSSVLSSTAATTCAGAYTQILFRQRVVCDSGCASSQLSAVSGVRVSINSRSMFSPKTSIVILHGTGSSWVRCDMLCFLCARDALYSYIAKQWSVWPRQIRTGWALQK